MIKILNMESRNFALLFALMICIAKMNPILGVEKEKNEFIGGGSIKKENGLRRLNEDNFIIVYFDSSLSDITYSEGFEKGKDSGCSSRNNIVELSYDNKPFKANDPLIITPSSMNKLIIYLSENFQSLAYFFSINDCDMNSKYITQIDFSNFNSAKITDIENAFSE